MVMFRLVSRSPRFNTRAFFIPLYINDIINTSTILQLILFADDTNAFVSHKDKDCPTNLLNAALNKLSIFFRANRRSLNLKKTEFIVFKPCQKCTNQPIQLLINSQKIDQVKETVFLGVIMDETLNWKSEISHVANRKRGRVQRIHVQTVFSF